MPAALYVVHLKSGFPSVEEARRRLADQIGKARAAGAVTMKIIHGYGSTGQGGALREAVRRSLRKRQKEGTIQAFVAGEKWDLFDPVARRVLDACPELARDPDLNCYNEGITIVLL
ncbi:MAG TPA: Smr/MutS family protein [Phycisphaerae bacterium]|jgi:hypothetical protein|nr:Smr/MutS family protein [Phycisphaerae bacterium]HOB73199.1 Smr/MutS family protein [Phycisphaerae bacterium]HOJ55112.1 Smr/MutS family protein [Phycisphaerae bacterium]HOL27922.1 Smr/MutS family protein [Phycisphaerae bacterium]HPP21735.1 Smr/MutS family protein [Phycisphaerae bacterium]